MSRSTINDIQAYIVFKMIYFIHEKFDIYLDKLSHKSIFPTNDHRWVSLNDNPLISDNDDIAQLFTPMNNIPLIDIPSSDGMC